MISISGRLFDPSSKYFSLDFGHNLGDMRELAKLRALPNLKAADFYGSSLDDVGLRLLEFLKKSQRSIEVFRCCLGTFVGRRAGVGALLHGIFSFARHARSAHADVRLLAQSRIAHDAYNAQSR